MVLIAYCFVDVFALFCFVLAVVNMLKCSLYWINGRFMKIAYVGIYCTLYIRWLSVGSPLTQRHSGAFPVTFR